MFGFSRLLGEVLLAVVVAQVDGAVDGVGTMDAQEAPPNPSQNLAQVQSPVMDQAVTAGGYPEVNNGPGLVAGPAAIVQPVGDDGDSLWIVAANQMPRDAEILARLGNGYLLVRSPADQVARGAALSAHLKIAPALSAANLATANAALPQLISVIATPDRSPRSLMARLQTLLNGAQMSLDLSVSPAAISVQLDGANRGSLYAIASLPEVLWIEQRVQPEVLNSNTVGPIQANAASAGVPPSATPIWDQGLMGTGQVIAIADSGLDRNEAWFTRLNRGQGTVTALTDAADTQPPIPGSLSPANKVLGYFVMPGATAYDNNAPCGIGGNAFHGTHVSGTAAGDSGVASTPTSANHDPGDGMAPQAQILFQDLGDDIGGCLTGQGGGPMWAQAQAAGAFIHSNSYGGPFTGSYNVQDFAVDDFLWRNEAMLLVFAAGNAGGQPGDQRVFHFGHAKHGLTVGANNRGANPTMWPLSSRGPASDGRIKPDITAPGVLVESAAGDLNDSGIEPPETRTFSGTSMATPAVAGAAAMARQYFTEGFYPTGVRFPDDSFKPSGTLLKALLLNGTTTNVNTPESDAGWGRVWLDNNLYFAGDGRQLRVFSLPNLVGLSQGESITLPVTVPAGAALRVTLVWYDPPPSFIAATALVNNLDLTVAGPGGTYLGNAITAAESVTGGAADGLNPVEQVMLSNPDGGPYTLTVSAPGVAGNGQPGSQRQGFALVMSAAQCDSAVTQAPAFSLQTDSAGVQLSIDGLAEAQGYQIYRRSGDCAINDEQWLGYSADGVFTDGLAQGGLEYAYRVRGVDGCGEGPISACRSIVSQGPCTLSPQASDQPPTLIPGGSFCAAQLSWPAATGQCPGAQISYQLHRDIDPFFQPTASTLIADDLAQPGFTDILPLAEVTQYYRFVAVDSLGNASAPSPPVAYSGVDDLTPADGPYLDGAEDLSLALLQLPWDISSEAVNSGGRSYLSASVGQNYPDNSCAALTTRRMTLAAGARLDYAARYDLEADFDGVVVEISVDGGAWLDLPPNGGYPGVFALTGNPPLNACGYPNSQRAFNGSSGGAFSSWQSDLSAYAGRSVRLRWRLSSDTFQSAQGFFLDDIQVTGATRPAACVAGELVYRNSFE